MAPKKNNMGHGQRSKTPGQTSASDPNPTATSPSAFASPGDATTAFLVPSSASSSAPPTTTTITHLIPSAPPQTTSHLPSSPSQITATTQPLPSVPPQPIRKTQQELISCTSDGATTTDLAGPSTAPSASAASTGDLMSLYFTVVKGALAGVQIAKEEDPAGMQLMAATFFGLRLDDMEGILECLLGLAGQMEGEAELRSALEALGNVEALKSTVKVAEMLLAERKKRDGSGGSCGGSKGSVGGPDSGSGEGDGESGGVSV